MPAATQCYRLFYVETDQTSNEKVFKIAADQLGIRETTRILHEVDLVKVQFFGVYGDRPAMKSYLNSIFPRADSQLQQCFADNDTMPTVWMIYNDQKIVLALISPDEEILKSSESAWSFIVVMQRFLQDISPNIIICPSKSFFDHFTKEHSFHGKPHSQRSYRQVETSLADIQPAQKVELTNGDTVQSLCGYECCRLLIRDVRPHLFFMNHKVEEENHSVTKKFQRLKESLQQEVQLDSVKIADVQRMCQECQIQVSQKQQNSISEAIASHRKTYSKEKEAIEKQIKTSINDLLKHTTDRLNFSSSPIEIPKEVRKQLIDKTTLWSINPALVDQTAQEYAEEITKSIYDKQINTTHRPLISAGEKLSFASRLQQFNKRNQMQQSRHILIDTICAALQSENQFDVYFNLRQISISITSNTQQIIPDLIINSTTSRPLALSAIGEYLPIGVLSETDRRIFADRMQFIACFTTYDGSGNILVLRRPNIMNATIGPTYEHTVFYLNNNNLRKVADYCLDKIGVTYACSSSKQTLLIYKIDTGAVTKCVINSFGQRDRSDNLPMENKTEKPPSVRSMALTVAQDLLILIDSQSNVYSLDLSRETYTSCKLLYKTEDSIGNESNFAAGNGDLYDHVQTIGERKPIFFFQSTSCVDILDQNYRQLQSIELSKHPLLYQMQVFSDSMTTYCIMFNNQQYEAFAVQNLISDTRIERQRDSTDPSQFVQRTYVGNRLLDVIKRGEIQFGPPAHLEKTKYHFILSYDQTTYYGDIRQYFSDLSVCAKLDADSTIPALFLRSQDATEVSRAINSRVPLHLCAIEMGTLTPLNNGRRERMDHLSLKSFTVDMKAREITFSYLEQLLNETDASLPIVGIIGRQSTGKSYLMNRLFRTRFAVAAGRCTDGIWLSYAVCNDKEFVVLDCEGLFSDQRTEDEEMKLLAFLTAMCDVTILSQDLGFSRYQDRLFGLLSKSVEKIGKSDKLFQGTLLIVVRDISDSNVDEAHDAAETKFMDLQKSGRTTFLEQLFCKSFSIQPLHHFENVNFNHEINELEKVFTSLDEKQRWDNGKDLIDRMKILLVQLYTDDFLDSSEVHMRMKLKELEETMKTMWAQFDLDNFHTQTIEKVFEDQTFHLEIDHQDFQLDDLSMEDSYTQLCDCLQRAMPANNETKEKQNRLSCFLDGFIPEVLAYRRQQVKDALMKSFDKAFPNADVNVREKRKKFSDELDQHTGAFKLRMCLKKCSSCDLKCVQPAQHTERVKAALDEAKQRLESLRSQITSEISAAAMEEVNNKIKLAKEEKNVLGKEKVRLEDEQRYLKEQEELESQIDENQSKRNELQNKIDEIQYMMEQMEKTMKESMSTDSPIENFDQMIVSEIQALTDPRRYQSDEQQALMKKFYAESMMGDSAMSIFDDAGNNDLDELISWIKRKNNEVHQQRSSVESSLMVVEEDLLEKKNQLAGVQNDINKLEDALDQVETEKNNKTKPERMKAEKECLERQLTEMQLEHDNLGEKVRTEVSKKVSDQDKIRQYIDNLEAKLSTDVSNSNDVNELKEARRLLKDLEDIDQHLPSKENHLAKLNKIRNHKEVIMQEFKEIGMDTEKEEQSLSNIIQDLDARQTEVNDLLRRKSSIYDENKLFKKILNQFSSSLDERERYNQLDNMITTMKNRLAQISTDLPSLEQLYEERSQLTADIRRDLETKRDEEANIQRKVTLHTEQQCAGDDLRRSLEKHERTLKRSLERFTKLTEVKELLNTYRSSSDILLSSNGGMSTLQADSRRLSEEKDRKFASKRDCEYACPQDYDIRLETVNEDYAKAEREVERLSNVSDAINEYSHIEEEITRLERQCQVNCDCGTDHRCSGQCQICPIQGRTDSTPCMFRAGHSGEHKCDAGHICQHLCYICQLRGDEPDRCHFSYNHQDPSYHQCERVHVCSRTCEICSEPCSTPLNFEGHKQHRCQSEICWKECMFGCGRKCVTKDHGHDLTTDQVTFVKDNGILSRKKHLCDQQHRCLGICDTPGICKTEYTTEKRSWETESGEKFPYDHIEVKATRNKCDLIIDPGHYSHGANNEKHRCNAQHTCDQRCPDCNAFCRQTYGHSGQHAALHRNKDQHVFTSTNPSVNIGIRTDDSSESNVRTYKVGESSQPENCAASCKRRGRGHFHLVECPGGDNCHEKKLGTTKARHSTEVYYYGVDQASPKKYDQILCSTYWSLMKWLPPVNEVDRKWIDSCTFFCKKHVQQDKGQIIKDSSIGFCTLGAWHTDAHAFECANEHQTLGTYQGVDICFVIDTTMSMAPFIEKVKLTITRIIEENEAQLKRIKTNGTFQFAIVDYRDHGGWRDCACRQLPFTNHQAAIEYVKKLTNVGNEDTQEAVLDGLDAACDLKWRDNADHLLFHVLDAPPHGRMYGTFEDDRWPKGCPCGKTAEGVLTKMKNKNIGYHVLLCTNALNMMIREFKNFIEVKTLSLDEKIIFEEIITQKVQQQLIDTEMTIRKTFD